MSSNPKVFFYALLTVWLCVFNLQAMRPNIVVIVADDFGLGDVGRQHTERTGNTPLAPTPAIDALADEGLWFTDAHSPASLCAPSRYAFMSGNYNFRSYSPSGVWNAYGLNAVTAADTTLGRVVQSVGYTTGFVGKWHLGGDFYATGTNTVTRRNDAHALPSQVDLTQWIAGGPQDLGFDYDFTLPTGVQGPVYVAHENGAWYELSEDSQLIDYDSTTAADPLFVSDKGPGVGDTHWDARALNMLLADKAAAFITEQAAEAEPFFLYYCSPAVHLPHTPPTSIEGEPIAGTTPSSHTDMNRVLDMEVERMVGALKATNAYENTLIIFTSDNGGLWDSTAQAAGHYSNGGYKGNKNSAWEGGHRVPFIVVWPGVVDANTTCDSMINGTDILATLAAVSGASFTDDQALDSHDLMAIFLGDTAYEPRSELMLQSGTGNDLMFRDGPWKLIISSTKGHNSLTKADTSAEHLFNLDDNPTESTAADLINDPAYASRVATMYERYWEIRQSSARSAPAHGASSDFQSIIEEDFTPLASIDTTGTNQQIADGNYDTGLRLNNHVLGAMATNPSFGTGNVLQLSTGVNPSGGWGALSAGNNPYPVAFEVGDNVTLSFDMLVQALPEGTDSIHLELRMSDATDRSRAFTEYTNASIGDVVHVEWMVQVDTDMANATDLSIWIPVEGHSNNYLTTGPNGDGTEIDVMQLDNIHLYVGGVTRGFAQFEAEHGLTLGKGGDDDGDGWANVFEYVFGLDPTLSDVAQAPVVEVKTIDDADYLTLSYQRSRAAEVHSALRAWRCTDLSAPQWRLGQTVEISVTLDAVDEDIEHVTERSLFTVQSSEQEFLKLEVLTSP